MLIMLTGAAVPELVQSDVGFDVATVPLAVLLPVADGNQVTFGKVIVLTLEEKVTGMKLVMTDDVCAGPTMVTEPVLMLTVTPGGPEMVVIWVCAETIVDNVCPWLSVTAASTPLVSTDVEAAEVALAGIEVSPADVLVDGAMVALLVASGAELLAGTKVLPASALVEDSTDEEPMGVADELPAIADERDDIADESTEADGGSKKLLGNDVAAGSPFVPANGPVGSPSEIPETVSQTDDGMLNGEYDDGRVAPSLGQVVVVVDRLSVVLGAVVDTTVVAYELIREDVKVSGQTVVEMAVLRVTTAMLLWRTGQFSSHGGQPRTVTNEVS
jgi:hypothetical protein